MARQKKEGNHEDAEKEKYEEIGNRLISIREALGYSVKDMAENLGLNYETYRNYERGISNIPLKVLKALREKFHVNLNYLIAGDGTAFSLKSSFPVKKSYFIGRNLRKLRDMLSISTSEFLSYLDSLNSEAKLIAIENNDVEAGEEIIEDICESFSVNPAWLIGRGLIPFRTREVNLEDLEKVCRTEYPNYRPDVLFTSECRSEDESLYFAIFLKGRKPYQGILLYEDADLSLWRAWSDTALELKQGLKLKEALQFAFHRGMYSVRILDRGTFYDLIMGRIHPVITIKKGESPTFPFIFALFNADIRRYLQRLEFYEEIYEHKKGPIDYGLLRFIQIIEMEEEL